MRFLYLLVFGLSVFSGCAQIQPLQKIAGEAQGTTWHIIYTSDDLTDHKPAIDSILKDLDLSLSTWVDSSIISRINRNENNVRVDAYFRDVFLKSVEISENTKGLFDVTVGPLVNAWGFGPRRKALIDSLAVDSLLNFVGIKCSNSRMERSLKQNPAFILISMPLPRDIL